MEKSSWYLALATDSTAFLPYCDYLMESSNLMEGEYLLLGLDRGFSDNTYHGLNYGYGYGYDYSNGNGASYGNRNGDGNGTGYGNRNGDGYCDVYGSGHGDGYGNGYGYDTV